MDVKDFKDIIYDKDNETGIVMITLNTPKRKNALSPITFLELFWAVEAMENDDTAGAMIITGAKDPDSDDSTKEAFSSGGYFDARGLAEISDEIKSQIDFSDIAQKKMTLKMFNFEKPIIAAINGLAIGAGYTMPLACADLIYMSEHAWINMPFINLGIIQEFAASYFLPRIMGFQKAKEIIYFRKRVTAQEALELGMVNEVLPHDELIPYAKEMALKLVPPGSPVFAMKASKRAMHKPLIDIITETLDLENEGLNKSFGTADFMEAMKARKEKRDPEFKW